MPQYKVITLPDGDKVNVAIGDDGVADLSEPAKPPIPVKIDNDVFYCASALPGGAMKLLGTMNRISADEQIERMGEVLDVIMFEESKERFIDRMNDPANPITIDQFAKMFAYVMMLYSEDRPTEPVSPSPSGQNTGGPSSMVTAPRMESIQTISPSIASPI